jgi:hypothetical protein
MSKRRGWTIRIAKRIAGICGIAVLASCAFDVIHVKQQPVQIQSDGAKNPFYLARAETFPLGTGFTRTLRRGTKWDYVGALAHGGVYRSRDQVFTVEASNIHEAYLVVSEETLVGFYLPVEKTYSPLGKPIALTISPTKPDETD